MRWDYLASLFVLVVAEIGVFANPVALKQTTREAINRRALVARTRPKRATASPGLAPPQTPLQTFVIQFTGTGQAAIDNTYGWSNPNGGSGFYINYGGTFAQAPVFYLDVNGFLVRADTPTPKYAYIADYTGDAEGGDYVTFGTSTPTPPTSFSLVKCTISANSELVCKPNNPNTQQTVQVCTNHTDRILGTALAHGQKKVIAPSDRGYHAH